MSLKTQMESDVALFLGDNEFAESVTYSGQQIKAVVEPLRFDGVENTAVFGVASIDVPDLALGQRFTRADGSEWTYKRLQDSGGGMHSLECVANQTAYRKR